MSKDRTAEQWLALDDLPTGLAKALTPCQHQPVDEWKGEPVFVCRKCGDEFPTHVTCQCSVPITIDCWNTAMAWRDKIIGDLGLQQLAVYNAMYHKSLIDTKENRLIAGSWFSSYLVKPRHWFIVIALMIQENTKQAAAMAAERKEE